MKAGKLYNYLAFRRFSQLAKQKPFPKVVYCAAPALGHNAPEQECMKKEESERVTDTLSKLKEAKLTPKCRESEIIELKSNRTATIEEIQSVHSRSYVLSIMQLTREAKDKGVLLFEDTELSGRNIPSYVTGKSLEDSLVAVGTGLSLVDSVVEASKLSHHPPIGFALIRPPGSHAIPNAELPMGYCIFNNIAIAARYAQRVHGLKRVFIIDFDVHHGKGTSDAFYDDPDVFYLSTHQDVEYRYRTGKIEDIGCDNGEGTTLNVPLPKLTGDVAMLNVFDEIVIPAVTKFKPDIILVSAGYNGHVSDSDGEFQMTTGGYYRLALKIHGLALMVSGGRCVYFLEGGLSYNLKHSIVETFRAFLRDRCKAANNSRDLDYEPSSKVKQVIKRIKQLHSL